MKVDVSKIAGYEDMSVEEKLQAIENFEIEVPEPDYSGYVAKDVFDKTAHELAAKKKELNAKLSEDEQAKQQEAEERKKLQEDYDKLLHKTTVSENKAKLIGLGYGEELAEDTAEAMTKGDLAAVLANYKKHLEGFEKQIRAEVLKDTPKPKPNGGEPKGMTLEAYRALPAQERAKYAQEHPDEYRALYDNVS